MESHQRSLAGLWSGRTDGPGGGPSSPPPPALGFGILNLTEQAFLAANQTYDMPELPYLHRNPFSFVAFLLVVAVVINMFIFYRVAAHQRRRGRSRMCCGIVSLPPPSQVHQSTAELTQIEDSRNSAIKMLPCAPWSGAASSDELAGGECALCLERYAIGEQVTRLPACAHHFHKECVERWFLEGQRNKTRRCPICRSDPLATPPPAPGPPKVAEVDEESATRTGAQGLEFREVCL